MTTDQVYQKIQEIYNSEKGKNFIAHLLRSFFPVDRAKIVIFKSEEAKYQSMKCCITGEEIFAKEELLQLAFSSGTTILKDIRQNFKESLGEEFTPDPEVTAMRKKLDDTKMHIAVESEKSDKLMSNIAFQSLHQFLINELLRDNRHIDWVIKQERGKQFVEFGKKNGHIQNPAEERVVTKVAIGAKMSLGDIDVLKQLKEKMEKEN